MSINSFTIRDDLSYKKPIILALNKLPQSISNKFGVKVNNFTYYSKLVQHIKSTKNYKKPTILLENNPKYRIKTSGEKFIFLSNHGYSKKLNLMFGFDYYTYNHSLSFGLSNSGFSFYFQVIVLNGQNELIFVINYNKLYDELFEAYLEYDSHKEVLLNGITEKNDNAINIKNYFENYKRLVKEILYNTQNQIYEYQFSYKNILEDDRNYKSVFCLENKKTRKLFYKYSQDSRLKPSLSTAIKLFYTKEYSMIIRQRICTSFISIKENLYNIHINNQTYPIPTLSYENKKVYIINNERSLVITDKLPTEYKKEIQKINIEQVLKKLIQINVNLLTKTKEKFDKQVIKKDKNDNLFIYDKRQIIENKITYIVQNVYAYIFLDNKKVIVYDNNLGIKDIFNGLIVLFDLNKKNKVGRENEYELNDNWNIILYNNNYFLINLHNRFLPYLLGFDTLKTVDKFVISNLRENISSYLFSPIPIETTLRIIKTNENKELLVSELPNISEVILLIDDEGQEHYVFSIKLLKHAANLSTINPKRTSSSYSIYYHVEEKKLAINKFELTFIADDYDYAGQIFNLLIRGNRYTNIHFTFSIKKEKWEKIKCENLYLIEVIGDFYLRIEHYNKIHFIAYDGDGDETLPIRLGVRDKDGRSSTVE